MLTSCLLSCAVALAPWQSYGGYNPPPPRNPTLEYQKKLRGGSKGTAHTGSDALNAGFGYNGLRSMPHGLLPRQRARPAITAPSYVDPGAAKAYAAGGRSAVADALLPGGQGAPGGGPLDAGGSKWGLVPATPSAVPAVPAIVLQSLTGGPLSEQEADALVALLTGSSTIAKEDAADSAVAAALNRLLSTTPDPELQSLYGDLDALFPATDTSQPRTIDNDLLRGWFQTLDSSGDAALSFLEWRDRTGLLLDLFRRVDQSGEGLVTYEEFARSLIVSAARAGNRSIDPTLLEWALESGGIAAEDAAADAAKIEALTDDELVLRARGEVAAAALQLRLEQVKAAALKAGAKGAQSPADAAKAAEAARTAKLDATANLLAPKPLRAMGAPRPKAKAQKGAKGKRGY